MQPTAEKLWEMKQVDPPTDPENNIQPKDNPAINIQHKETDLLLGETAENKDEPKIQGAENVSGSWYLSFY